MTPLVLEGEGGEEITGVNTIDINPAHRRNLFHSPCHHYVRLSFGPPIDILDIGLDAIERVLRKVSREGPHTVGHSYKLNNTEETPAQLDAMV